MGMRAKVVLITGASSGIGAGTAVLFAAKGCHLALTGRSESGLKDTLQACVRAGAKEADILLIPADLQVFSNLSMVVEKTVGKFGKLDVLVNNAGLFKVGNLEMASAEDFDQTMETNVKGVFFLTQQAMPHLVKSKGNVVNVSSVLSQRPPVNSILYGMSKAALDHFTRTAALDAASKNVRVNVVSPGGVKTPIYERSGIHINFDEYMKKSHALGRGGTVDEVGKAILFLADEEQASFITGVNLLVDGGAELVNPF